MSTDSILRSENQNRPSRAGRGHVPSERWFVLLLGALSAGLLGMVVGSFAIDSNPPAVATLATAGYLLGFLLARSRLSDMVAHLCIIVAGVLVSLLAIDPDLLYRQSRAGEWRAIADHYEALIRGFLSSAASGDKFETEIAVFGIGLTIWLVASLSAWMLFRRGWVFWSVATPGAILLMTLALDRDRASWPVLAYLGLAFGIAAGHAAIDRTLVWNVRGIERPRAFGWRSIVFGSLIAILAVALALSFSFDLNDRFIERATQSGDRLASWVEERFDSFGSTSPGSLATAGNYGAFSDQFKVGDGVPSGDVPIVVVQANGEKYLAARRLDNYDGTGWRSTTGQDGDAASQAPRIAFQTDQPMNIPRDQIDARVQDRATITLLQPTDNLLFTIDQHFSASEPTLVRVGWEPVDQTFSIGQVALSEVPVDLRELVELLQSESFAPRSSSAAPEFENPIANAELERIRARLLATYPVSTELTWTDEGGVLLHASGRLPVYSDIQAVYSASDLHDATYSVVGLAPAMFAEDLEGAGMDYPRSITDTYLELPDSATEETRDLANEIVARAGAATPFDQAIAIQDYLRQNFTYRLDAGPAPDGRDIVDYFLFESRVGRCDHYASSMAVMLRMLGVPTRIVTGFAPVSLDPGMNGYVYRGRDAHAWVEVYFPGFGWIPFEPTPSQEPVGLDGAAGAAVETPEPTREAEPTATPATGETISTPQPTATATPLPAPAAVDTEGTTSGSNDRSNLLLALGGAALIAGGLAGFFLLMRRRTFTGLSPAGANYSRLQRLGHFVGVEPSPELTPREFAARFGAAKPKSAAGATTVAEAFTRERYATDIDAGTIARDSDAGWKEAKQGASDWRLWRRR